MDEFNLHIDEATGQLVKVIQHRANNIRYGDTRKWVGLEA